MEIYEIDSVNSSGERIRSILRMEEFNHDTTLYYENEIMNIFITGTDIFPFNALEIIRLQLEKHGLFLMCKGNRKDVYPGGQLVTGLYALVLQLGKRVDFPDDVWIFEKEDDYRTLATVSEQAEYYEKWAESIGCGPD